MQATMRLETTMRTHPAGDPATSVTGAPRRAGGPRGACLCMTQARSGFRRGEIRVTIAFTGPGMPTKGAGRGMATDLRLPCAAASVSRPFATDAAMLTDLSLAAAHHLLVFGLIAMLVSEAALLRGTVDTATAGRLARLDGGYGACAVLLLGVGTLRVLYGIKGYDFYLHNPWFHAKVGLYVLTGLLSALPTLNFMRWRRALRSDPTFAPAPADVARARRIVRMELAAIAVIFVLAAAMARYGGF